jgi:hypothetical protein
MCVLFPQNHPTNKSHKVESIRVLFTRTLWNWNTNTSTSVVSMTVPSLSRVLTLTLTFWSKKEVGCQQIDNIVCTFSMPFASLLQHQSIDDSPGPTVCNVKMTISYRESETRDLSKMILCKSYLRRSRKSFVALT